MVTTVEGLGFTSAGHFLLPYSDYSQHRADPRPKYVTPEP